MSDHENEQPEGFPRQLNFEVFLRRLEAIKGTGFLEQLSPGLAALLEHVDFDPKEIETVERILRAMTLQERLHPDLLSGEPGLPRRERVADKAGTSLEEVDGLIFQFQTIRELLRDRSPQEVIQELLDQAGPQRESWQGAPDAWKQDGAPLFVSGKDAVEELSEPEPAELSREELTDVLLRKIAESGIDSLSPDEREALTDASAYYRNRRKR